MLRRAVLEDLAKIAAIQAEAPEASQWEPMDYLRYECWVSEQDEAVVGFIVTRRVATDECEILNLAIAAAARRSGVARTLLNHVMVISPGNWFLEVRESNRAAISLYEATGFRRSGTRSGYYQSSPEAAIVMHFQS
jgi:ribosomal-protein-alanine N-acetyltransferase